MECPKCHGRMQEKTLSTLSGSVTIDKCVACHGLWFDLGEAEILKDKWMSEHIDDSGTILSKQHDTLRDIDCPRCGKPMIPVSDPKQKHLQYETCAAHGMYFDAGEFTDFKYETLMDYFRDFIFAIRRH